MNIYTSKVIPEQVISEHIETVFSHTNCDFCGERIHYGLYDAFETTISFKVGDSYPESGSGQIIEFDICESCVKLSIVPLLQSKTKQEVKWKKWDW